MVNCYALYEMLENTSPPQWKGWTRVPVNLEERTPKDAMTSDESPPSTCKGFRKSEGDFNSFHCRFNSCFIYSALNYNNFILFSFLKQLIFGSDNS